LKKNSIEERNNDMKKVIYELKQTFHHWYLKFNDIIVFFEYAKNVVDQYKYLIDNEKKIIIMILDIDNILLVTRF